MVAEILLAWGGSGLFILAFIEAIFWPIPAEVLLIPLTLLEPSNWVLFATLQTVGSILGGMAGYWIGKVGGRPILKKLFNEKRVEIAERYYKRYGDVAVFVAGFSPIPYKIFAISSGAFKHNFIRFLTLSVISRALKSFVIAFSLFKFGPSIVDFLRHELASATLVIAIVVIIGHFTWKKIATK